MGRSAPEKAKAGLLWNDDPRLPQLERTLAPVEQGAGRGPLARVRRTLWPDAAAPRDTAWLNRRELVFTQASVLRRAAVLKRIVGITAAVIIALAGLAVFASLQANEATIQRNEANTQHDGAVRAQGTAVAEANVRATAQAEAQAAACGRKGHARIGAEREKRRAEANLRSTQAQAVLESNEDPSGSLPLLLAPRLFRFP